MSNVIQIHIKSIITTMLAIAVLPLVTLADTFVKEDVQSYEAASLKSVAVSTGSGDVTIAVWDKPVVEIKTLISVKAKDEEQANELFAATELAYEQEDDQLSLNVKSKSKGSFFNWFKSTPRVNVTVMCPANMNTKASSGSGDIHVSGVSGEHKFTTGSGDIKAEGLSGVVKATTGSGDVSINGVNGTVKASTGSGDVRTTDLTGTLNAGTGSGSVDASGAITAFDAGTGSGSIRVDSSAALAEKSKASTGSGNVRVKLPAEAAFTADLKTHSGTVECNLPIEVTHTDKKALVGNVNGGGPELVLRAGSGNLSVEAH